MVDSHNSYDSNRPASESSPFGSDSVSTLKATINFEGSADEVTTAIFGQAQNVGRLNEVILTLDRHNAELNGRIYTLESDVRRERNQADRANDELREARRNHQVVLGREQILNDRIYNVSDERNKLYRENERLKAALGALAGSDEALKEALENFAEPEPQTASSEGNQIEARQHESPGLDPYARSVFDKMTPSKFSGLMRGCAAKVDAQGGSGKIAIIRVICDQLGASLKEAKDLVEYNKPL